MRELVVFYLLFWWFVQVFYKVTFLDQEDCRIKTFVRRGKTFNLLGNRYVSIFLVMVSAFLLLIDWLVQDQMYAFWFCLVVLFCFYLFSKRIFFDFLSALVDCQLCMESHIGFIISIPIVFYYNDWRLLALGYSAAGLNNIIKRVTDNE